MIQVGLALCLFCAVQGLIYENCLKAQLKDKAIREITYSFNNKDSNICVEGIESDVTVYVELVTASDYDTDVEMNVELASVAMDENSRDLLIIGKGNQKDFLRTSPSLMFVQSQAEANKLLLFDVNVTLAFYAQNQVQSDFKRKFLLGWNRIGREMDAPATTPSTTTPRTEADRQAVILCFKQFVTCPKFEETYEKSFKTDVAFRANEYVELNKINLLSNAITPGDVKVECLIINPTNPHANIDHSRNNTNNFLIVSIRQKFNPDLPVFKTTQLQEIFKDFDTKQNYEVTECRTYPNYWYWYWGTAVMLLLIMIMIITMWKWTNWEFWNESNASKPEPSEGQRNLGFVPDDEIKDEKQTFYGNGNDSWEMSSPNAQKVPENNWHFEPPEPNKTESSKEIPRMFPTIIPPSPGPIRPELGETALSRQQSLNPYLEHRRDSDISNHTYVDIHEFRVQPRPDSPANSLDIDMGPSPGRLSLREGDTSESEEESAL